MSSFGQRLDHIKEQMAAACRRAGRPREEVRLMGVSKMHPAEALVEAADAGLKVFGENRVQEFAAKRERLKAIAFPGAEFHFIGHLQSNKSAAAAEVFDTVDSVDSLRLAERLNEAAGRLSKTLPILLEMKLSTEETKTGLAPGSAELRVVLEHMLDLPHLALQGLMTVPPLDDNPETARECFRRLRELRDGLAREYPRLDFRELSMGMSGDFEIAIEEGSTLVRIGTALFGTRSKAA